MTKKRQKSM